MLTAGFLFLHPKGENLMKQLQFALVISCILFCFQAIADSIIKTQTQGDVTFVSGGVGGDERNAMQAIRGDFNLSLLFTVQGTGEYLSAVKVNITDKKGNTFLDTVSDGPMLLVSLKPGHYTVNAEVDGKIVHKNALIVSNKRTSLSFIWTQ